MPGELQELWEDPASRLGVLGGAFVSLWMIGAYVAVPYANGWIARDAFFLVEAAVELLEASVWYHVVGLVVPGVLATVSALLRYGDREAGTGARARIAGSIVLIPVLVQWSLMVLWVLLTTVVLPIGSDIGVYGAIGHWVLFLFGGTFVALFVTPVIVAGIGSGTVVGSVVVAVGRRVRTPDDRRSEP